MEEINWDTIVDSDILILKENETIQIKFLDNGFIDSVDIVDKKTNKTKTIKKYVFRVINLLDNKKMEFSTLASRLMGQLKVFKPIKGKSLNVNKFRTGTEDFDVDFRVSQIK